MGYETRYELKWEPKGQFKNKPNCEHKFDSPFCPQCGVARGSVGLDDMVGEYIEQHEELNYALEPDGSASNTCKWYSHAEDMIEMSKKFKNILFTLNGEGEESGDIWVDYYLNGKSQSHKAQIILPECDEKAWK